jgi:hypothetical protein
MRHTVLVLSLTLAAAAPLAAQVAQDTSGAVRPGMSEADVIARWGQPIAVRRTGEWTYLFFDNGMEREVGYFDVVFLQGGQVVDAIVRMPGRVYLGQSSSPPDRYPEFTPPQQQQQPPAQPVRPGGTGVVSGIHVNP